MIAWSSKGEDPGAAIRYVEGPGRDQVEDRATFLGAGGVGFDPQNEEEIEIAKRLLIQNGSREMQGEKDRYCDQTCMHLSLSWDPAQTAPDLAEKREAARQALAALGMESSMHLVYDHSDKEHPHIHIVASRIDPHTRKAYDDYQRVRKSLQWTLDKEREDAEKGLRPIPEAKKHLHDAQREPTLEDVQALYAARKQEQGQRYRTKQAVDELYKAHERERQMTVDDGVGGRWAKDVPTQQPEQSRKKEWKEVTRAAIDRALYGNNPPEQVVDRAAKSYGIPKEERRFYYPKGELQKKKEQQMASLREEDAKNKLLETGQISQEEFNRVTTRERKEPKRSIIERITERAPKVEQTQAIERERGLKL